jgi:hypothetical protein
MTEPKAQAALEKAVQDYLAATGWNRGYVVTGWLTIVDQAGYDGSGIPISARALIYMNGHMPDAQALGLLQIATDIRRGVGQWAAESGA